MTQFKLSAVVFIALLSGCTQYEFDVVSPPDATGHVGQKDDKALTVGPLEYRLRAADGRLVLRAFNRTAEPIALLGGRSVVVDPSGQSRPLPTQTIAPGSFIKLIFPPLHTTYVREGPSFGIGIGGGFGERRGYGGGIGTGFDDGPTTFREVGGENHWEWDGESQIRLTLVYQTGGEMTTHQFVIARVKAGS